MITSTDHAGVERTLRYQATEEPVQVDSQQQDHHGEWWIVVGGLAPHKSSSSGRVRVRPIAMRSDYFATREFFPHVFDMEWA